MVKTTRMNFLYGALAAGIVPPLPKGGGDLDREKFQREIDDVVPAEWNRYYKSGLSLDEVYGEAVRRRLPALRRYEDAFDKVLEEIRQTEVTTRPAVWFVYNMGIVVKTVKSLFSVDLHHRRAELLAPSLDFALITHNHSDHYTDLFYEAMNNKERKTVVSNFKDNYGVDRSSGRPGGYTRAVKTIEIGDVKVRTTLTDHNDYLVDRAASAWPWGAASSTP